MKTRTNLLALTRRDEKYPTISKAATEYVVSYAPADEVHLSIESFKTFEFLVGNSVFEPEEFLQAFGTGAVAYPRVTTTSGGKQQLKAGPMGGELTGTSGDDVFIGGPGEDFMTGNGGNDEFRPGGPGGAMVTGGTGNDVYLFSKGDGYFLIGEQGGVDDLRFGPGIKPADVTIEDRGSRVDVLVAGSAQNKPDVRAKDRWSVAILRRRMTDAELVDRFVFADGTVWNKGEIQRRTVKVTNQ